MRYTRYFRRPLSLADRMVIVEVLVGMVVAFLLVVFAIVSYFAGWF